ncbi:Nramp family divalent metal transporter [Pseudohongiella sp. SYSU M77423]|uniref:Nramp family divalent metal transporter n=1 Tax=Pseudohongiella sp. SYSU M77423 TaxID=3042312 RepID=UPI002480F59F|nr:Nramp family divalent metal transporter [Pseudohongiella sp. SYSU M77423]MDH7943362.1 Nramp family divalent metal transporter [Pseudohongiella sp. SYSU M77423]
MKANASEEEFLKQAVRDHVARPPLGYHQLRWYGPGLLWMLSSVGTGSILFTPRVAAAYEYQLLWLLVLVVFFMWVMIREMARYSIVTGQTMLEGMHTLAGPRNWAVWLIFLPQLLAAAVGIAGLSSVVGGAIASFAPGGSAVYAMIVVAACTSLTATGRYSLIEKLSRTLAIVLLLMVVIAAAVVFPGISRVGAGLSPGWPSDADLYVILPWVGTILAGSMGIIWFGYWTATRGYGGGLRSQESDQETVESEEKSTSREQAPKTPQQRLQRWISVGSGAALLGCLGGLIVLVAFMILGAELLAAKENLPQGTDVAIDLTTMFSGIWGAMGKWMLLTIVFIALVGSIVANQDGWGRSFADMCLILSRRARQASQPGPMISIIRSLESRFESEILSRIMLKRLFILSVTGLVPLLILAFFRDPVQVMSASGIIAAAHTPFIVVTALIVNRTRLPKQLRPNLFYTASMSAAGIFYAIFAVLYIVQLINGYSSGGPSG